MNLDQMLQELRQGYLIELDQKIQLIEGAHKYSEVSTLRDCFHKLKGSGATYGVPEITMIATILEAVCDHKKSELKWAVPSATQLIKKVQETRLKAQSYKLESDSDFQKLRCLLPFEDVVRKES